MDEERKEKKKVAIVKTIFKWIGLGIVTVLLIAGVIFQAPWKITGLLLILLLACTVLPKPARKWFWLSVGVIVIGLVTWVFLPEGDGDWRPYTFDEEQAALEAKYAIPDEKNAAIIYSQLLKEQNEEALYPDFLDEDHDNLTMNEPWSSKEYPELAEWLETQQDVLTSLIEASKIEKCRFPIYANIMISAGWTERLSKMRRWTYLLIRAANNDVAENRTDQAVEKYVATLQIGKHLRQQLTMLDALVGVAMEALVLEKFNSFIIAGDPTKQHLNLIEQALAKIEFDWTRDFPGILDFEKLITAYEFGKYYEVNPKGRVRLSRDPWAEMRSRWKEQLEADQIENKVMRDFLRSHVYLTYWQKKLIRAKTILWWFYMPATPQKAAAIIDASHQQYYAMAEPDFDWKKQPRKLSITGLFSLQARLNYANFIRLLTNKSEESYYKIHDIYLRVASKQRGTKILIALRRYKNKNGNWPESLEDIKELTAVEDFIDSINGGSFVYKLTDENFTFYSKGKNNIDEGGQYNVKVERDPFERKVKADDRSIWPDRYERRKHRKETIDAE